MANNKKSDWDKMIYDFIAIYDFTSDYTEKEIFAKVNKYLQEQYKGRATKEHISHVAEDVTESICLTLNISC